jgi:hypothetical protein
MASAAPKPGIGTGGGLFDWWRVTNVQGPDDLDFYGWGQELVLESIAFTPSPEGTAGR